MSEANIIIGTALAEKARRWLDEQTTVARVGDKEQATFSARALWEWLEKPDANFRKWWSRAKKRQNLKDDKDFVCCTNSGTAKAGRGGHNEKDYFLTPDAARQVVASDSSPKGRAVLRALLDLADRVENADPAFVAALNRRYEEKHGRSLLDLPWHKRLSSCIQEHIALVMTHHLDGFTVLMEAYPFIQAMELSLLDHDLQTFSSDLADNSIGLCWSNFRFGQGRCRLEPKWTARVTLPGKGEIPVIVYPECERNEFRRWLVQVYMPEKCPSYFKRKYMGNLQNMAPISAADMACRRIAGCQATLTGRERLALTAAGGIIKAGSALLN